jgi:hypothetical protein
MSVEMVYRTDRYLRGGDHNSFLSVGSECLQGGTFVTWGREL